MTKPLLRLALAAALLAPAVAATIAAGLARIADINNVRVRRLMAPSQWR